MKDLTDSAEATDQFSRTLGCFWWSLLSRVVISMVSIAAGSGCSDFTKNPGLLASLVARLMI